MKIFAVYNNYDSGLVMPESNKSGLVSLNTREPIVYTMPDTALLKDDRPFFIPDYALPCTYQAALVVRISRLGRSISARFAHRYYDAMTVGITFTAANLWAECCRNGLPWDVSKGFDGAAVIGRFFPIEDGTEPWTQFSVEAEETVVQAATAEKPHFAVADIIAYVSRFYLLRQGDLIYTGFPCPPQVAVQDQHLTAYLNGAKVLSFNVK